MIEELKAAVAKFEAAQRKYSEFGAQDTEPDSVFQWALADAFNEGTRPQIGSGFWQLYDSSMDCTEPNKALTEAATVAIDLILDSKNSERQELKEYLSSFMWRADLN